MSTTLPFGHKLPTDGDRGSSWFDDLEANIAIDDAHTHDGNTSAFIPSKNLTKSTSTILSASWAAVSGQSGTFSQTIVLPSGVTVAKMIPKFQINTAGATFGDILSLAVHRVTNLSYEVFIIINFLISKQLISWAWVM